MTSIYPVGTLYLVLPGVEVIHLGQLAILLDWSYPFVTSGWYISCLNLISRSFQCEFSWFLNPFTVFDSITFAGKLFQVSTTLCEKLYFLILVLQCFLQILCLWPLVVFSFFGKILLLFTLSTLLIILSVSIMSDLNLLYCKDGNPRYLDLSL